MTTKSAASFLFLLLLLFCRPGVADPGQNPLVFPDISSKRLLNGLQIYVASTPHLGDAMVIGLVLRYGSAFDRAGKGGLAHLTSRMFAKATLDRTAKDIQDELGYLDSSLEVRCDWDGIRFLLRGHSATFERALLLLYQVVCEAEFTEEDFAAMRSELLRQLQTPEDPRSGMRSRFEQELYRGTTYGRPLLGTPATAQNITIGDVRYFYRMHFSPDQAAMVVVGSAAPEEVLQKATRIWGVWIRGDETPFTFLPPRTPAGRTIFLEDDPGSPAAQFILGNLWPRREEPVFYSCMLAVRILQERLTQVLPTSLLTVAAEGRRLPGPFYIQGQAAAGEAVGEINKILDAVAALKQGGITDEEVKKAQDQWIEEFGREIRTTEGICNVLLDSELYRLGINYLATFSDFVQRSNPSLVGEAAKRWLFPGGFVLIVRGPAAVLKPQLDILGTVQTLKR
jgi:zinc protease